MQKQIFQGIDNEEHHLTESQAQFAWKVSKPSTIRNRDANDIHYMKSFEETHLCNYPKLKPPMSSFSQSDFQWKSKAFEENLPITHLPNKDESHPNPLINRCKSGFGKLLNPSATTNNLTYRTYSRDELNSKDIITFWNWKNTLSKNLPKKLSRVPYREYQSCVKHVPNGGLISEAKSNYVLHLNTTNFDASPKTNRFICFADQLNESNRSENSVYGSGIRIQKYI